MLRDVVRPRSVLALTATATRSTVEGVRRLLGLSHDGVKMGVWRRAHDNVRLMVCREANRHTALVSILQSKFMEPIRSIIVFVATPHTTAPRHRVVSNRVALMKPQLRYIPARGHGVG